MNFIMLRGKWGLNKSRTIRYESHGPLYYLKEGAEVGLGVAVIYLIVALAALI